MPALYPDATSADLIRSYAGELASIADGAALDAAVSTCGDWTLADLVRHLTDVQSFWAFIIENRPAGPDSYDARPRMADRELASGLRAAADALADALVASEPSQTAWSWAEEQTVGFTIRRQTHEALVRCARVGARCHSRGRDIGKCSRSRLVALGRPEGASVRIDGAPELVSKLRELITSSTQ